MNWKLYLSGENELGWREKIETGIKTAGLPITFLASNVVGAGDPEQSDSTEITRSPMYNTMQTLNLIETADVVVVSFDDKHKQSNAAFDASYATALGKPVISLHEQDLSCPLIEVDTVATVVAQTPYEIVEIVKDMITTASA